MYPSLCWVVLYSFHDYLPYLIVGLEGPGGGRAPPLLHRLRTVGVTGGLRGAGSPPLWGPGQHPGEFFLGPYIRWADLHMVCAWFLHMVVGMMVFGPWYWMLRHV